MRISHLFIARSNVIVNWRLKSSFLRSWWHLSKYLQRLVEEFKRILKISFFILFNALIFLFINFSFNNFNFLKKLISVLVLLRFVHLLPKAGTSLHLRMLLPYWSLLIRFFLHIISAFVILFPLWWLFIILLLIRLRIWIDLNSFKFSLLSFFLTLTHSILTNYTFKPRYLCLSFLILRL